MSVVKVGKIDHGYEILPRSTLQDLQLSVDALGSLVRLVSMPEGWQFRVSHVETEILQIGRDRRRKIFAELIRARYLIATKNKGAGGTWEWTFEVFAVPQTIDGFSGDGLTDDGLSVAGQPDDLESTYPEKTYKEKLQQQPAPDGAQNQSSCGLVWPKNLHPKVQQAITSEIVSLDTETQQQALDELAARLAKGDLGNPLAWFQGMVARGVTPTPGGQKIAFMRTEAQVAKPTPTDPAAGRAAWSRHRGQVLAAVGLSDAK